METLGTILKGKNYGVFKNDKGEYCQVSRFYVRNNQKFQVIFSKSFSDLATRNAINSTSEKRILKLLKTENFVLENI